MNDGIILGVSNVNLLVVIEHCIVDNGDNGVNDI